MDFRLLQMLELVPGRYFMAVAADAELGVVTSVCLTWTAAFALLQGAGLLLEIMQMSTGGWLLSAKSWRETFLFILLKDTDGNHS